MRLASAKQFTAGLALILTTLAVGAAPASARTVLVVHPGQSIQAALDAAKPGDTVFVRPGVYHENLEITTDDVTLVGDHATVEPPAVPTPRRCSVAIGRAVNPFGLCVTGELASGLPPKVLRRVEGVTVRGLTVGQFPSTGIVTLGADRVTIRDTTATGGTNYGILLSQTTRATVADNRVTGGLEAGIYVGDSPATHTSVVDNSVSQGGVYGIFIRNSSNGVIADNRVSTSCIGIALIPTLPDPATVSHWLVTGNLVRDNDQVCLPPDEGGPTLSGMGVFLAGTDHVTVTDNKVEDNAPPAGVTPMWSGGIVLISASVYGGPAAVTNSVVAHNSVHGNQAFDINIVDPLVNDRIVANRCGTSFPAGLC